MKNKNLLKISIVLSLTTKFFAQDIQSNVDPIVDLRAPRSLFEALHDGINDIYTSLQAGLDSGGDGLSDALRSAQDDFGRLSDLYDGMINTARNHQVVRDDKEFLQKMIDRINSLIDELENKQDAQSDEDGSLRDGSLRSVKDLCQSLQMKISI